MTEIQPEFGEDGMQLTGHVQELRAAARGRMPAAEILDAISAFAGRLQEKYPDCSDRRVFHALIGSTPAPEKQLIEGDFPGDDSVVSFLESLGR